MKAIELVGFRESKGFTHDMTKLKIQRNKVRAPYWEGRTRQI